MQTNIALLAVEFELWIQKLVNRLTSCRELVHLNAQK